MEWRGSSGSAGVEASGNAATGVSDPGVSGKTSVTTIGIIGATAGSWPLAYAAAAGGYAVVLEDVFPSRLADGVAYIRLRLDEDVAARRMSADDGDEAIARVRTRTTIEDACREADLLIETAAEDFESQLEIFTLFDKFAKPDAILASSTTLTAIADLAEITFCPENCVGLQFSEGSGGASELRIVRGAQTSEETVSKCMEVGRRTAREVVVADRASEAPRSSAQ
jgi:3-hydroxybutyryl-CoA dehydrogenase